MQTVAVYVEDDADSPHVHAADEAIGLTGTGGKAYLDYAEMLAAAKKSGAELTHPGYGFLSGNAEFARACAATGCTFVGPDAEVLELVGNKSSARAAAIAAGVPVLPATEAQSRSTAPTTSAPRRRNWASAIRRCWPRRPPGWT